MAMYNNMANDKLIMTKNILITGCLGHIGSKFIHSINSTEYNEVRMVDNLVTQRYPSLFNLPSAVNYKFHEADINKTNLLEFTNGVDVVVHLAAITDAASSFKRRDEVEKVNYEGTRKVAEACIETGAALLFPSTTSVYGSQSEVVDETCPIEELKPQSPYAEYKLKSESMLKEMGQKEGLKFVICRFGTIFGTSIGMRFHTAVNKFCWQAVMAQPLTVWKTALDQKRPYLGLNDACRATKYFINQNHFDQEIYNIVTQNHTVRDIIEIIKKMVPEVRVELVESEIMNQLSYDVKSEKISSKGFESIDSLEEGVKDTINLFRYF